MFKWHFWSLTNSDFPTNQTFHQFHDLDTELDLHWLWVVSMEHLQGAWHISRERLPLRTPGSSLMGACICSDCWDQFSRLYTALHVMTVPNLTFTEIREVSMEHLRRMWHASREHLPFWTPGSVPPLWDLLVLQLLRPDFSNLPCLYSTFHLEYPLVLSRFCSVSKGLNNNCSHCLLNTNKRQRAQLA